MNRIAFIPVLLIVTALPAAAIQRHPTGVNVNTHGATTVFITFGGLDNQVPAEAFWCGELVPAAPDVGFKCNPATIFGRLPLRYDLSRTSGTRGFTDIMSIPPSVSRRAYQAAASGTQSSFFYVRRFASTVGGPDEYVFVTCRLAGGGARTPLALLDVQLGFDTDATVLAVERDQALPPAYADLVYTGTGRLVGRWEVVMPGDDPPGDEDLLTAATLPVELRPLQRRYSELGRFNVFLPPGGRFRLEGPDPRRLPAGVEGMYMLLLRIEASDDKEGDSNLAAAGAGQGVVHTGGVAGFPIPPLRYYVGTAASPVVMAPGSGRLLAIGPTAGATLDPGRPARLTWTRLGAAAFFLVEVMDSAGAVVASALLPQGRVLYELPAWVRDHAAPGVLRWRVAALDTDGRQITSTDWQEFSFR